MRKTIEIEDIEYLRKREGIDDSELRTAIGQLRVGDCVKLTLLTGRTSFETLLVRITSIKNAAFRGKLAHSPVSAGLSQLRAGSPVAFTTGHIHSIPKEQQPSHER